MTVRRLVMMLLLSAAPLLALSAPASADPAVSAKHGRPCAQHDGPVLTTSVIQPELADQYSQRQWRRELEAMKAVCMDTLVLQWTADTQKHTTVYPSGLAGFTQNTQHDLVDQVLRAADAEGMKVWLGTGFNDDWWSNVTYDRAWFLGEIATDKRLMDDLWARYRHHRSLSGWYITQEPWNVDEPDAGKRAELAANLRDGLADLTTHAHQATRLPTEIAPFFYPSGGDPDIGHWKALWSTVLSAAPIDIIVLQDGVGAGHTTIDQLPAWFAATREVIQAVRPATKLWVETETLSIADGWKPMGVNLFIADMLAVRPYVDGFLAFSFNHYQSPQRVNPLYFRTLERYARHGKRDLRAPSVPRNPIARADSAWSVRLTWSRSHDDMGVVAYRVYRDGQFVGRIEEGTHEFADSCLTPQTTYAYTIVAIDAAGNESARSAPVQLTTPAATSYPVDLALHKPYNASTPAHDNYPDTAGTELTDGQLGTTDFLSPAWQARLGTDGYDFTIDLGSVQTVHEVTSRWLQVTAAAIILPAKVSYSVSSDGQTFAPVGAAPACAASQDDQVKEYSIRDLHDVQARYVRVEVSPDAAWTFTDEAEVR
jgi:Domain of unknown function (DUF4434)/F5/8 type C domain